MVFYAPVNLCDGRACSTSVAVGLAYLWIVYLGALCEHDGWRRLIHPGDRCDLSLFQLGLRLLEHLLNENRAIPVAFYVSIET